MLVTVNHCIRPGFCQFLCGFAILGFLSLQEDRPMAINVMFLSTIKIIVAKVLIAL